MNKFITIYFLFAWSSVFAQRTTLPNTATQSPSNKNLYNANGQVITGRLVVNDSCWFNGDQSLFDGNVGIGTVSPDFKLHVAGSFFAEKTVGGRTVHMGIDTFVGFTQIFNEFTSGDTSNVMGVSPGDVYMRSNTNGTDYDVIINISDPAGVKIQGKSNTGNALTIFSGATSPFQGDTLAKFANDGTVTFTDLAGTGTRYVTASATGVLGTSDVDLLYFEEDTVESADILNMRSSPVELIATPGAGKAIQITQAIMVVLYNTTPYASNGNIRLLNGDNPQMQAAGVSLQLSATRATVFSYDDLGADNIAENYPIELSCGTANPTAGDSDVIIKIWYRIIDLETDPY